jgi:hypothetical protein
VPDVESGHILVFDTKHLKKISQVVENQEKPKETEDAKKVNAANIHWHRHGEQKCSNRLSNCLKGKHQLRPDDISQKCMGHKVSTHHSSLLTVSAN